LLWRRAEGLAVLTSHSLTDTVTASISPGVSTWIYLHRVAIAATVHRNGEQLRIANCHLASHSADERIAQARRVVALVGPTRPAIVAGDFNGVDEVEVLREFRALDVVDPGGEFTNPSIAPRQRIDFVLVPEIGIVTARLTPEGGKQWDDLSDHLPLLVEFSI
jgi:endonuclease/exonuclease/phosphatase family metal-dependent hydrolase